jgi:hypothetical protein
MAKTRKVAGLIPDKVIGIFHFFNPTIAIWPFVGLGLLTEISTRNISWG